MFKFDLNRRNKAILNKIEKNDDQTSMKKFPKFYISLLIYYFDSKFYREFNGVFWFLPKYVFLKIFGILSWKNSYYNILI